MTRRLILVGLLLAVEGLTLSVFRGPAELRWLGLGCALFALLLYAKPLPVAAPAPTLVAVWTVAHVFFAILLLREAEFATIAGPSAFATALLTALPWRSLRAASAQLRWHAAWTLVGTLFAATLSAASTRLREPLTDLTFFLARGLLSLLVQPLIVDPAGRHLGTARFRIELIPACSGGEGILLFFLFFVVWCVIFRGELRVARALALLPLGLVATYALNVARVATTLLIGDAGWPEVATGGFHNYAGWITYLAVAFGWLIATPQLRWLWAKPPAGPDGDGSPASPYLLPFLGTLGAGILSSALSAGFEWAYGLRVLTGAGLLWAFRPRYRGIDWRVHWSAPLIGVAVFALWLLADLESARAGVPEPLADSPPWLRLLWIAVRLAGAVITVPLAEELAFRGFLLRRLVAPDFEAVSWAALSLPALGISSVIFGMLHTGPQPGLWPVAMAAGLLYGLALCRRGRLGESVVAHATTNALLAGYVLATGRWQLW